MLRSSTLFLYTSTSYEAFNFVQTSLANNHKDNLPHIFALFTLLFPFLFNLLLLIPFKSINIQISDSVLFFLILISNSLSQAGFSASSAKTDLSLVHPIHSCHLVDVILGGHIHRKSLGLGVGLKRIFFHAGRGIIWGILAYLTPEWWDGS